jgi:hypothetical protein
VCDPKALHALFDQASCCLLTLLPTCLSCSTFLSPRGIMMIALIAYWVAQYFGYIK